MEKVANNFIKTEMSIGILPIGKPTAISAAAVLKKFIVGNIVAISSSGLLRFYKLNEKKLVLHSSFELFGDISNLIEIDTAGKGKSNLMVILSDGRFSILHYEREFRTIQTGNLLTTTGVKIDEHFKVSQYGYQILVQSNSTSLEYIEANKDQMITAPLPIHIPCLSIVDFTLIYHNSAAVKFAALCMTFDGKKELKFFLYDEKSSIFEETHSIQVDSDAYKLIPAYGNRTFVMTTNKIFRCRPDHRGIEDSATIYTSDPIVKTTQIDENISIGVDEKGNAYAIRLPSTGKMEILRIGGVNCPVSLSTINESSCAVFSKTGQSYIIEMISEQDAFTTELCNSTSPSSIILPLEDDVTSIVGISKDSGMRLIRRNLTTEGLYRIKCKGCPKVWFFDDNKVIASLDNQTHIMSVDESGVNIYENPNIIANEQTVAFSGKEGSFIQITPSCTNINGNKKPHSSDLVCCYCTESIAAVFTNDGKFTLLNQQGEELMNTEYDFRPNKVAANEKCAAFSLWNQRKVIIIPKDGEMITLSSNAVDLAFQGDSLFILEDHDVIKMWRQNETVTKHFLEGSHTQFNATESGIIVCGDSPALIKDNKLYGIVSSSFVYADTYNDMFVQSSPNNITISEISHSRITVQEVDTETTTYDATLLDSGNFCVAFKNDGSDYATLVDYPLNKPSGGLKLSGNVSCMTSIQSNGRSFVVLALDDSLILCEDDIGKIKLRFTESVSMPAFHLQEFNSYLMAAFENKVTLYAIDCVSLSDVKLRKVIDHPTLGATTAIAANDNLLVVGDAIESIIVYEFNDEASPPVFTEVGRNLDPVCVAKLAFMGDDILVSDTYGNLYSMGLTDVNNYISKDIAIKKAFHLGSVISALYISNLSAKIFISTESGAHYLVCHYENEEINRIIDNGRKEIRSVGYLSPIINTSVLKCGVLLPDGFKDLSIVNQIDALPRIVIDTLAAKCEMDSPIFIDICDEFLSSL